jgi:hypothetical protein
VSPTFAIKDAYPSREGWGLPTARERLFEETPLAMDLFPLRSVLETEPEIIVSPLAQLHAAITTRNAAVFIPFIRNPLLKSLI